MQQRRILLGTIAALMSFTLLTGFTHNKIPGLGGLGGGGGGGGGNWTAIAKDGKEGLSSMASATAILVKAQEKLAKALGLKKEAADLRRVAADLEKCGETCGAEIDAAAKTAASVQKEINSTLMKSAKLDAETAAAVGSAGKDMIPALGKIVKGVSILVKVSSSISSAGQPSPTDLAAVKIASTIPPLMPKAAQSVPELFATANDFRKVAAEKNIAMPEVPAAPGFS